MSPFKGQGANQALLDAVVLAQHLSWTALGSPGLVRGGGAEDTACEGEPPPPRPTVEAALARYEDTMLARVALKVRA